MKTIILNHKSYLSYDEITKYKLELEEIDTSNINLVLMPNIAYISLFRHTPLEIGSQNFNSYNYGSYTGETCLEILKNMDINYTLVAHPERLILRLDTYDQTKDKFIKSLNSGFKTILCVGHDENLKILKKELKFYLKGIDHTDIKNLILAYEPSSKIEGTKVNLKEINFVCNFIKKYIKEKFNEEITFIYGGSVTKDNIEEILKITDGVIIGKISTDINEVKNIIEKCKK